MELCKLISLRKSKDIIKTDSIKNVPQRRNDLRTFYATNYAVLQCRGN